MKALDLPRVPAPPPPPEPKLCVACKAYRAECVAPVGESSAALCWLCAHHVVDHECPLHEATTAECECLPHQIYPGRQTPALVEAASLWRDLYEAAGILECNDAPPTKGRSIDEINADIARLTEDVKRSPLFVPSARSRVVHCGVCGEQGHYAKTCPTVRRGR